MSPERQELAENWDRMLLRLELFCRWKRSSSISIPKYSADEVLIVAALELFPPGLTVKGLTRMLGKSYASIMSALQKLGKAGLINRNKVKGKRSVPITLTTLAKSELKAIFSSHSRGSGHFVASSSSFKIPDPLQNEISDMNRHVLKIIGMQQHAFEEEALAPQDV